MTLSALQRQALLLAVGLLPALVQAETLDFRQCVELALAQNPELMASRSQIAQAEASLRQAEAGRLPRLNLSLTATHTNDPLSAFGLKLGQARVSAGDFAPARLNDPKGINNLNTRAELVWPVYTGGQVESAAAQARALIRAAQSGDAAARQQLIQQVLAAYQGVHTARAYVRVAEQAVAAAEESVRVTQRLHQQGMAVKSDVLSARVHLEDARVRLAEARNGVAAALDRLKLLLGKSLDDALDVGPPVMPRLLAGSEQELRRQAIEGQAQIAALRAQMEAAGAAVEAARAGRRPQVSLLLRQDFNDKGMGLDASSQTVAGMLTWTAFDAGATRAAIDRAEAGRQAIAARLRQAEDDIALQVAEARRRALEAEERLAARELAAEQAEAANRIVKRRYENAMATVVELLAAQTQLDRARAEVVAARHDLALRRAELARAVGVLNPDQI
ncbi:MAG: TolC family protein [Thiobacillaceae bacterium]